MARVEILVEEPSMATCLKIILPHIVPEKWKLDENYFIRPHQGKGHLKKSIINKMPKFNHWYEPIAVVVVHDQDSADCKKLKQELKEFAGNNINIPFLIRIVCKELESWYLGDMRAIQMAYQTFNSKLYVNKEEFRIPDKIVNPKEELKKILPVYQEISSSQCIASYMDIANNRSYSFNKFITGIQKIFNDPIFQNHL